MSRNSSEGSGIGERRRRRRQQQQQQRRRRTRRTATASETHRKRERKRKFSEAANLHSVCVRSFACTAVAAAAATTTAEFFPLSRFLLLDARMQHFVPKRETNAHRREPSQNWRHTLNYRALDSLNAANNSRSMFNVRFFRSFSLIQMIAVSLLRALLKYHTLTTLNVQRMRTIYGICPHIIRLHILDSQPSART